MSPAREWKISAEEINSSKVTLSLAAAAFISAAEYSYRPSADKYISSNSAGMIILPKTVPWQCYEPECMSQPYL